MTDSVNKAFAPMADSMNKAFAPMTESVNKAFAPMTESVNKFVHSLDPNYQEGAMKLSDDTPNIENPLNTVNPYTNHQEDDVHASLDMNDVHNPMVPPVYATLMSDDDFAPSTSYENAPYYNQPDTQVGNEFNNNTSNVISPFHRDV